jgi:ABC-type branched-subunit amino acid transport system substrate-binding protein
MFKHLRIWWILGVLLMTLVVAGAACDGDGADKEKAPTPEASPTEAGTPQVTGEIITFEDVLRKDANVTERAEVEWGWMFEESGPLQAFGEPTGDGVKLAVQEINEAGGFQVGDTIYTIKLLEHDTRSDPAQTVAVAQELVRDDQVKIIWGPAAIGDPESTQITQPLQVLHICPCADREHSSLSSPEQARGDSRWAFQTLPAASGFLPIGARDNAKKYPELKTFATMCDNTEAGQRWCEMFEEAYKAEGFEHVGRELFPPDTTDFTPYLTEFRQKNPDMILNFVDPSAQFGLLRQSWEMDVGQFYIAAVALPYDMLEALVGEGIRDKIVSVGGVPRVALEGFYTSEEVRAFFEEKYKPFRGGSLPIAAFGVLLTYDPVYMLVAAMQQAGTVEDTTKIADALEQIRFNGVGEEELYFDKSHIYVSGNDSCYITGGQYVECFHNPPPTEDLE